MPMQDLVFLPHVNPVSRTLSLGYKATVRVLVTATRSVPLYCAKHDPGAIVKWRLAAPYVHVDQVKSPDPSSVLLWSTT